MKKIERFFGWLFATEAYMATLTDEQIAIRALGRRKAYQYEQSRRQIEEAGRQLEAILAEFSRQPVTLVFYEINPDPKG